VLLTGTVRALPPAGETRVTAANFKQANKYSNDLLKQFIYSTSVEAHWVGKSESFWYEYRTSKGKQWYRVNPATKIKEPLFDRVKLAAQLSEEIHKPLDSLQLPLNAASLSDDGAKFKFVTEDHQFEYELVAGRLVKLGKAPKGPAGPPKLNPEQKQKLLALLGEDRFHLFEARQRSLDDAGDEALTEEGLSDDDLRLIDDELRLMAIEAAAPLAQEKEKQVEKKKGGKGGGKGTKGAKDGQAQADGYRNYSPDRKTYAFIMDHNLYVAEDAKEDAAIQLTKDGNEDYTFAGGFGGFVIQDQKKDKDGKKDDGKLKDGNSKAMKDGKATSDDKETVGEEKTKAAKADKAKNDKKKSRAPVTWSKDSKTFYVMRQDSRGVKDLFLVNSVSEPRPTLMKYKYAMPGEEHVRKSELYIFDKDKKALVRVDRRWKDESYSDLHWGKTSDELRFVRANRLLRSAEFCALDIAKNEPKCLFLESFENSNIATKPVKYIEESDEMIWWSEKSGWGHFYLYDRAGKLKNAITSGDYRASAIVAIDAKNRFLFFRGNGREPGENVYFNHLYRVNLDGTGLTLLDPGAADHESKISPSHQIVVDNYSRVDSGPVSVLRDARGANIMELEVADLSKLYEVGWKMPETFVTRAADGITDLYGNLYKPFDFDPKKKYPIIAHVYPGPQTESTPHNFKQFSPEQQLAQLGFIVIQVGNRGGTPLRSKAYQSYGYGNLRDYGLADKKTSIEQLADRFPWIDIERVGIYGHSGGGFMSAAAMLVKPYNEFFKVAVASAGNHDNNIYNNSWAERYHGIKEVPIAQDMAKASLAKKDAKPADEDDEKKSDKKDGVKNDDETKSKDEGKQTKDADKEKDKDAKASPPTRFEIKVPTNTELAANLRGHLLLVHGDMDNNVHPANTIRLVDALIKANKRFDMLILPGKSHGFASYQPYFVQRMWEYFAEHMLDDRPMGVDLMNRR
jgi:dipeptidyl aminopeptidase/acylaminoacyl peptidase